MLTTDKLGVGGRYLNLIFSTCCSSGAFGYFEVTHDITQYCKAKVFEHIGKRTPLAIRFSTVGKALNSLCVFCTCALRAGVALWTLKGVCNACFIFSEIHLHGRP